MKLRSSLVYFCHEEFVIPDGWTSRGAPPNSNLRERARDWFADATSVDPVIWRLSELRLLGLGVWEDW